MRAASERRLETGAAHRRGRVGLEAFVSGTRWRSATGRSCAPPTRDHPRRLPRSGQDRDAIPLCAAAVLAAFSLWRTCVVGQRLRRREARGNLLLAVLPGSRSAPGRPESREAGSWARPRSRPEHDRGPERPTEPTRPPASAGPAGRSRSGGGSPVLWFLLPGSHQQGSDESVARGKSEPARSPPS